MSYNWTETGILPAPVREIFNCGDHHWVDNGFDAARGHRYLSLNTLGISNLSPTQVADLVKANLGAVFPGGAVGSNGPTVTLGNIFSLGTMRFRVKVVAIDAWSFTLKTEPWHILIGTARHGILKDSTSDIWLMQEGVGEPNVEGPMTFTLNYMIAPGMWREMATNIRRRLLKS